MRANRVYAWGSAAVAGTREESPGSPGSHRTTGPTALGARINGIRSRKHEEHGFMRADRVYAWVAAARAACCEPGRGHGAMPVAGQCQ